MRVRVAVILALTNCIGLALGIDIQSIPADLVPTSLSLNSQVCSILPSKQSLPVTSTVTRQPWASEELQESSSVSKILSMQASTRLYSVAIQTNQDPSTLTVQTSLGVQMGSSTFSTRQLLSVRTETKAEFNSDALKTDKTVVDCDKSSGICTETVKVVSREVTIEESHRIRFASVRAGLEAIDSYLRKETSEEPGQHFPELSFGDMVNKAVEDHRTLSTWFGYSRLNTTLVRNLGYNDLLPAVDWLTGNRSDYKWYRHIIIYRSVSMNPKTGARMVYRLPGKGSDKTLDEVLVTVEIWPRGTFYNLCVSVHSDKTGDRGKRLRLPSEFFATDEGRGGNWNSEIRTESYWPTIDGLANLFQRRFHNPRR